MKRRNVNKLTITSNKLTITSNKLTKRRRMKRKTTPRTKRRTRTRTRTSRRIKKRNANKFTKRRTKIKTKMYNVLSHDIFLGKDIINYYFTLNNTPITFEHAMELLYKDNNFRNVLVNTFKNIPYEYYMFGMTKIKDASDYKKPFKLYIKPEPAFKNIEANPDAFKEKFIVQEHNWSLFLNISGDALLLVPNPPSKPKNKKEYSKYINIGSFVKNSSDAVINTMFKYIGEHGLDYIKLKKPVYINTHGFGVPWLHIRFDSKPKYCYWY